MAETHDVTVTGVLRIEIPDPAIKLTLTFEPTSDGDSWDPERLSAALQERGVKEGYTTEALADFLREAAKAKDGPVSKDLITGVAPQDPNRTLSRGTKPPKNPSPLPTRKQPSWPKNPLRKFLKRSAKR